MFDVFLSYNSEDGDLVYRIAEKLTRASLKPWLDRWCLTPGKPWQEEMATGLFQSSACAVFVGPADLGQWEREELGVALDRAVKDRGFRIFLVLLPGLPEPFDVTKLSPFLSTRTWVDFRQGFQAAHLFQPLVNAIKGLPFGSTPPFEPDQTLCPYRGLQVFHEEHAKWFFGRTAEIQRILEKLKTSRFLAIIGPSGSGKSSLARAGLLPRIREGALPNSDTWPISVLSPGGNPLASLSALLLHLNSTKGMTATVDALSKDPRTLHLASTLLLSEHPSATRMVLVIDQFEEIFTLCSSEVERTQFIENVVYAGSQPGGQLTVVLTMRADFYQKCAAYPDFSARLASHQFLVSPMSEEGLRQAIEAPAHLMGQQFEEGLVDTILKDISTQPGSLPLLEHALMELWGKRRYTLLTLEGYREIGGIEGALAKRADSIFLAFSDSEQEIVKRLMLRLTQPGDGTEDTRRRIELRQLSLSHSEQDMINRVVDNMVNSRLLTISRDETTNQENLIEVSHEALIRGWPKLRRWIDADREGLREHHRINEAAQEWIEMEYDDGYLFRGLRLAQALEWCTLHENQLNEQEQHFIHASVEKKRKEDQATLRRRQRIIGGLLIAILLISGTAIVAMWERAKADEQRALSLSRELAAHSDNQFESDPERSLLLAWKGLQLQPTIEAQQALIRAINFSPIRNYLKGHEDAIWFSDFHPDNTKVLTASDDGTARLFDVETGATIKIFSHKGAVNVVKFSPNGKWTMTGSNDSTINVWSGTTGELHAIFAGHRASIIEGNFSPDNQLLATTSHDKTVKVWHLDSKRLIQDFTKHRAAVTYVAFSPNGQFVASASKAGEIFVWDPYTGKIHHTFNGHKKEVWMLDFHPSGHTLLSASYDNTARVWDLNQSQSPMVLDHHAPVHVAHFSPDGKVILTAGKDAKALVWDAIKGEPISYLQGHSQTLYTAEFSPNSRWILTASFDGTAKVWDWQSGPLGMCVETLRGHKGNVYTAIFSSDGKLIFTAGEDGMGRIWRSTDRWFKFGYRGGGSIPTKAVFLGGNNQQIFTGNSEGLLKVLDLENQTIVGQLHSHTQEITGLVFDKKRNETITTSRDGMIIQWNYTTGNSTRLSPDFQGEILSLSYNPSKRSIVLGQKDNRAKVWELDKTSEPRILDGHSNWVTGVAINTQGNLVATASLDETVRLWDHATGTHLRTFTGHRGGINSVVFSPDSRTLLTASEDFTVRLWDTQTGMPIKEFWGHSGPVHSAEFNVDGKLIVTASDDRTVRIWDIESGKSFLQYAIHGDTVKGASFHPNKDEILSFSTDGTIRVFAFTIPDSLDELLQIADKHIIRDLTQREIQAFLPKPNL